MSCLAIPNKSRDWEQKIQKQKQSGLSVSRWCQENMDLSFGTSAWRREFFPGNREIQNYWIGGNFSCFWKGSLPSDCNCDFPYENSRIILFCFMYFFGIIFAMTAAQVITPNQLENENAVLRGEIFILKEQLDWFKRQLFGKKSEKTVSNLNGDQLSLEGFDGVPAAAQEPGKTISVSSPNFTL